MDRDIGRGRGAAGGELLEDDGAVLAREAGTPHVLAHIDAGEAEGRRLAQCHLGENLLLVPVAGIGRHLGGGEIARHLLKRALLLGKLEIHATPRPSRSPSRSRADHSGGRTPVN